MDTSLAQDPLRWPGLDARLLLARADIRRSLSDLSHEKAVEAAKMLNSNIDETE